MIARFMRFFHMSDQQVLNMPVRRFLVLNRQIATLEAEEEARAISTHHTGKPKERIEELAKIVKSNGKRKPDVGVPSSVLVTQHRDVSEVVEASEIEALRQRQKESAARLKAEREQQKAAQ